MRRQGPNTTMFVKTCSDSIIIYVGGRFRQQSVRDVLERRDSSQPSSDSGFPGSRLPLLHRSNRSRSQGESIKPKYLKKIKFLNFSLTLFQLFFHHSEKSNCVRRRQRLVLVRWYSVVNGMLSLFEFQVFGFGVLEFQTWTCNQWPLIIVSMNC